MRLSGFRHRARVAIRHRTAEAFHRGVKLLSLLLQNRAGKYCFVGSPHLARDARVMLDRIMVEEPDARCVWLLPGRERDPSGTPVECVPRVSLAGAYHFATCSAVFTTHELPKPHRAGPLMVYLWHGMPVKQVGNYLFDEPVFCLRKGAGFLIATSEFFGRVMQRVAGAHADDVAVVGLPRNDILFSAGCESDRSGLRAALSLRSDKFILWLPTFRDDGRTSALDDWSFEEWAEISRRASEHGLDVVIKLHPLDRRGSCHDLGSLPRVHVLTDAEWAGTGFDLYKALSDARALITDISSVAIDYIVTGRPIGIVARSIAEHRETIVAPEVLLASFERLADVDDIYRLLSGSGRLNLEHRELLYGAAFRDGGASLRVYDEVRARIRERARPARSDLGGC